jgi:hypothetical protein
MDVYAISFENGSNLFINAKSMVDAVGDGVDSLLKCLPEGFGEYNVKPTIVRRWGNFCKVCGKPYKDGECVKIPAEAVLLEMEICLSCASRMSLVFCSDS